MPGFFNIVGLSISRTMRAKMENNIDIIMIGSLFGKMVRKLAMRKKVAVIERIVLEREIIGYLIVLLLFLQI